MPPLQYYLKQRETFAAEYANVLFDHNTRLYFERLKAHYRFRQELVFWGYARFGGHGSCSSRIVKLSHHPSIGLLAHEVAHAIQFKRRGYVKTGKKWHTKEHNTLMGRVIAYIMAHKEAWKAQEAKKMVQRGKVEENRQQREAAQKALSKTAGFKLARLRERERKLLTKAKRTATLLKKVQRQIRYYERKGAEMPSAAAEQPGIAEEIAAEVFPIEAKEVQ